MITIIAAAGENNEIGLNNGLVWHLPDDFRRFKDLTTGHNIIMGRKTFESFPSPLPNRKHVVISRQNYQRDGIITTDSMEKALKLSADDDQPFIIGGGEIYKLGMALADKIELTRVHGTFDADAYFPHIPEQDWKLVNEYYHPKDARHDYAFTYETWVRK